jgi:hypothetical protein
VSVTPYNNCYPGTTLTKAVTLETTIVPPRPGDITGVVNVCGTSTTYSYSVGQIESTTGLTYSWVVPSGVSITTGQGSNKVTLNIGSTFMSGEIQVFAVGECGVSLPSTLWISKNPTAPTSISGGDVVCGTKAVQFVAAGAKYASTYSWSVPAGMTINSGQGTNTISVTNTSSAMAGQISVVASNACNSASAVLKAVQAVPLSPLSISGPLTPCANSSGNKYSVPTAWGVIPTAYSWTIPAGATITSGVGTSAITVKFGATAGNIAAMYKNTCGFSAPASVTVSFNCRLESQEGYVYSDDELELENQIYPNPFHHTLIINLLRESKVEIMDIKGSIVRSLHLTSGENEINTMDIVPGIYFISIRSGEHKSIQKFVKE